MISSAYVRLLGLSNIAIIALTVAVGYRLLLPEAQQAGASYEPGERVTSIATRDLERAPRTLLISVKSSCPHCIDSLPFYRQLVADARRERADVHIAAVTFEPVKVCEEFLKAHGVTFDAILQPGIADPKLMVVPDLLLVGPDGVVLQHWRGALSKQGQRDVSRALSDRF